MHAQLGSAKEPFPSSIYLHLMNTEDTIPMTQNPVVFYTMSCNFKQCKTEQNLSQNTEWENRIAIKPVNFTKAFCLLE